MTLTAPGCLEEAAGFDLRTSLTMLADGVELSKYETRNEPE